MAAPIAYYVDPALDSNSGSGTIGDPFGDLQYSLNNITRNTSVGDVIYVRLGVSEVLTAPLSIAAYGAPTGQRPLIIHGFYKIPGDFGLAEIDGNGLYGIIEADKASVHFINMRLGNSGSNPVWSPGGQCHAIRCEFHSSSNVNMVKLPVSQGIVMMGCWLHGWNYVGVSGACLYFDPAYQFSRSVIYRNFFDCGAVSGYAIHGRMHATMIACNIIHMNHVDAIGINSTSDNYKGVKVIHNSIFNESAGTLSGIEWNGDIQAASLFLNNIIEGWSGIGGTPFTNSGGLTSPSAVFGNNMYFNNNVNAPDFGTFEPVIILDDMVSSASPFLDAPNNDFRVTLEAREKALIQRFNGIPLSENKEDLGACQTIELNNRDGIDFEPDFNLLQEDGSLLLQEDGFNLII